MTLRTRPPSRLASSHFLGKNGVGEIRSDTLGALCFLFPPPPQSFPGRVPRRKSRTTILVGRDGDIRRVTHPNEPSPMEGPFLSRTNLTFLVLSGGCPQAPCGRFTVVGWLGPRRAHPSAGVREGPARIGLRPPPRRGQRVLG